MAVRAGYKTPEGKGSLRDSDIERAILYAIDNGARIINMSFGGFAPGAYEDKLRLAYREKIVLVAAAGNNSVSYPAYPAAMDEVVAVATTDYNDNRASFSNYGDWVDVAAPGRNILSILPNNQYASWNGTSMACPYVAGISGLILAGNPNFTPQEVSIILRSSTERVNATEYIGTGRANAHKAVQIHSLTAIKITEPADKTIINTKTHSALTISGTAGGDSYILRYGVGIYPLEWREISRGISVVGGTLGVWDVTNLNSDLYTLELIVTHNGSHLKNRINVILDPDLKEGWPVKIPSLEQRLFLDGTILSAPAIYDINLDGLGEICVFAAQRYLHTFDYNGLRLTSSLCSTAI
jgi:subtilisin family serine protease